MSLDVSVVLTCDECNDPIDSDGENVYCYTCYDELVRENKKLTIMLLDNGIDIDKVSAKPVYLCPLLGQLFGGLE